MATKQTGTSGTLDIIMNNGFLPSHNNRIHSAPQLFKAKAMAHDPERKRTCACSHLQPGIIKITAKVKKKKTVNNL